MINAIVLFWICLFALFFCYIGYGLFVSMANFFRSKRRIPAIPVKGEEWPAVTLIIAAYNESVILNQKVENTKGIDYPADKLKVIFVTDGSTDGSERIVESYSDMVLTHQDQREGKLAAIARVMKRVETPIVFFSDANSMLNKECIKKMVVHYADPATGGVAGEKKIISQRQTSVVGEAEGLYWRYESFMKKQDAHFNTVVGAAGELFSIRTKLFDVPSKDMLLDDFIISMNVCLQGYKIKYEPGAYATEFPSASLEEEAKRKIRISAGDYQAIGYLKDCLNFFKYPRLSFQYISRRILRWICPLVLLLAFATNLFITTGKNIDSFYSIFLIAQLCFYFSAFLGWLLMRSGKTPGILLIPFYFVFMNYCLARGFIRFLKKEQTVLWERSIREAA